MKSIMEQASSIIKAIEKAWDRAGKPEEFSIKVFEKEEKNFLGMTSKPAKVGIFFEEKQIVREKKKVTKPQRPEVTKPREKTEIKKAAPEHKPKTQRKESRRRTQWSDEMVSAAQSWVKNTLSLMGMPNIDFKTEILGKNLKLTFDSPVLGNRMQEKQLFRSFAHLIIASLRNQLKQELRDLKVVLVRP